MSQWNDFDLALCDLAEGLGNYGRQLARDLRAFIAGLAPAGGVPPRPSDSVSKHRLRIIRRALARNAGYNSPRRMAYLAILEKYFA